MFEAVLKDGNLLRRIVDAIRDLCPDVNLECDHNGLEMQTMDDTHVALMCLELGSDVFAHYRCDVNIVLGVHLESISNALKGLPNGSPITIQKQDDEEFIRIFTQSTENELGYRREAFVKLINLEHDRLHLPPQDYAIVGSFPSKTLQSIFKDYSGVTEHVRLTISDRTFHLEGADGHGRLNNAFRNDHHGAVSWRFSGDCDLQLEYGLRYLNLFAKATSLCDKAVLSVSEGVPLMLRYAFSPHGHLSYYLAPKIE